MSGFAGAAQLIDHVFQLLSHENGNNGRRRLVGAQPLVVAHVGGGLPQQIRVLVHRLQNAGQHQQKLNVFMGRFAGVQQVDAVVGNQGPVVVLAGAVDAGEGLFMEQAGHAVTAGYLFQRLHNNLIVVRRQVGLVVNRGQLMLGGSRLVVLGLGGHSQLPKFLIDFFHIRAHPLPDGSEIVIVQFLAFGRHGAEQGAARIDQVFSLHIFFPVHQEILLFRSYGRNHPLGPGVAEQAQNPQRLHVDGLHGTQQRRLLVQRLAGVGAEGRRDAQGHAQGVFPQKCRRRAVPGRIASGFKGRPKTAGRERRSVRLAFDQFLAGKFHNDPAFRVRHGNKRIVLFRRYAGQRLEPVGIMGGPPFNGPVLHGMGYNVGDGRIQFRAILHGLFQLLKHTLGKPFFHNGFIEYVFAENLGHIHHFIHGFFPLVFGPRRFACTPKEVAFPLPGGTPLFLYLY